MKRVAVIAWRDFRAAFNQPQTFYFFALLLAVAGGFFAVLLGQFSDLSELARQRAEENPAVLQGISIHAQVVAQLAFILMCMLLVIVPLLTMRTFAEEQKTGTLELLLTAPVSPLQLVLGKYFGALALVLSALALTLWFPAVLVIVADPDPGPLFTTWLGLGLAAAAFTAVGVLASTLTESPLLSAFLAFAILVVSTLAGVLGESYGGPGAAVAERLSLWRHVGPFRDGVVDLGATAWLLAGIAGTLFVTQRVLESRRWR